MLFRSGFTGTDGSSVYAGSLGQHVLYPLGGHGAVSPGAKDAAEGSVVGAGTGGLVGEAIVTRAAAQALAVSVLERESVHDLETPEDHVDNGDRIDFDPRIPPNLLSIQARTISATSTATGDRMSS